MSEISRDLGLRGFGILWLIDLWVFRFAPGLYAAARKGTPELIDCLLSYGGDIRQTELSGETLLHLACAEGNTNVAEHLLKLGLEIDNTDNSLGESALHQAVRSGHLGTARRLLEIGADPNIVVCWDGTALNLVTEHPPSMMFELLKSFGAHTAEELGVSYT